MTDVDDRIRRELRRTFEPGDPTGVAARVLSRTTRRRGLRGAGRVMLAAAVIGGTLLGVLALSTVFRSGDRSTPGASGPLDASSRPDTSGRPRATGGPPVAHGPTLDLGVSTAPDAPRGLILFSGLEPRANADYGLFTLDPRTGAVRLIPGSDNAVPETAAWSPDGSQIAFMREEEPGVFVMNADGSGVHRIIRGWASDPAWSPDGSTIVYEIVDAEGDEIHVVNADGSGDRNLGPGRWPAWSPDGSRIVFNGADGMQLQIMDAGGGNVVTLAAAGLRADWSPDGSLIAYCLDDGIYVIRPDGSDSHKLIGADGVFTDPSWSPDGSMIAFSYDLPEWAKQPTDGGYPNEHEVFVMRADGSEVHRLTDLTTPIYRNSGTSPDWQPAP
jgi:TolB protein